MIRKFELAALSAGLALAALGSAAQAASANPTACDRAAAHPDDPDRVMPGLERGEIAIEAAVETCREVLAERPGHARTAYQLGRVLFYQGQAAEAFPYLVQAEEAGYRQAIFVLGFIDVTGASPSSDACTGLARLRRGVALDHPWSSYYLVNASLDGTFANCDNAPEGDELATAIALARSTITVDASDGRVEALAARLKESAE